MIFRATTPDQLVTQQLKEARIGLLEQEKAAEYHQAMAAMYRQRIERLEPKEKPF